MKKIIFLPIIWLAIFFSHISAMKKLVLSQTFEKHTDELENISKLDDKVLSFSEKEFILWRPSQNSNKKIAGSKEEGLTSVEKFDNEKIITISYPKIFLQPGVEYKDPPISTIKIWDIKNLNIQTFEKKEKYGYLNNIKKLNNTTIFSHQIGKFLLWNVVTKKFLSSFGKEHFNWASKENKTSFCMLDETKLLSIVKKQILMWNPKEKKQTKTFEGHETLVRTIQKLDDHQFLSTDYYHIIKLWDDRMNKCKQTFENHTYFINKILPIDDDKIASCSMYKIIVYDETRECGLFLFETDDNYVETIEKVDKTTIASGHKNGQIKLWNIENKKCIHTVDANKNSATILFSLNPDLLLSSCQESNKIKCWKVKYKN